MLNSSRENVVTYFDCGDELDCFSEVVSLAVKATFVALRRDPAEHALAPLVCDLGLLEDVQAAWDIAPWNDVLLDFS